MYLVRAFAPVTVTLLVVVRAQVRFSPFRRQIAAVAAHVHHNLHLYTTIQSTLVHLFMPLFAAVNIELRRIFVCFDSFEALSEEIMVWIGREDVIK